MFKWVPYSQRYLVLGLVGLALWLVSGIALNAHGFFPVINGLSNCSPVQLTCFTLAVRLAGFGRNPYV